MATAALKVHFTLEVDADTEGGDDRRTPVHFTVEVDAEGGDDRTVHSTKHRKVGRSLKLVTERRQDDQATEVIGWDCDFAGHIDCY